MKNKKIKYTYEYERRSTMTFSMGKEFKKTLKKYCQEKCIVMSAFVRQAIVEKMKRDK